MLRTWRWWFSVKMWQRKMIPADKHSSLKLRNEALVEEAAPTCNWEASLQFTDTINGFLSKTGTVSIISG